MRLRSGDGGAGCANMRLFGVIRGFICLVLQDIASANTSIICVRCSIKLERSTDMKKLLLGVATAAMMITPAMSQVDVDLHVHIPPPVVVSPPVVIPAPVTIPLSPPPPPPLGWVYARYVSCGMELVTFQFPPMAQMFAPFPTDMRF